MILRARHLMNDLKCNSFRQLWPQPFDTLHSSLQVALWSVEEPIFTKNPMQHVHKILMVPSAMQSCINYQMAGVKFGEVLRCTLTSFDRPKCNLCMKNQALHYGRLDKNFKVDFCTN